VATVLRLLETVDSGATMGASSVGCVPRFPFAGAVRASLVRA
jgi:hypothetical protein